MLKRKPKTRKIYSKCPKCGKRKVLIFKIVKKNYPFGRKSKPIRVVKKTKLKCFACKYKKIYVIDKFKNNNPFNISEKNDKK